MSIPNNQRPINQQAVDNYVEANLQDVEMLGTKQRVIFEQYQLEIDHIEQDIDMWIELVFHETSMTWKLVFDAMTTLVCFETGIISFDDEFAF